MAHALAERREAEATGNRPTGAAAKEGRGQGSAATTCWASRSQRGDECFGGNPGLTKYAGESSRFQLSMHRDYAASCSAFHYGVASALPHIVEAEFLERSDYLRAGYPRKFRYAPV